MAGWRELLEASTVALDLPEAGSGGTGFVIAPGVVVTCAHVVAGPGTVRGRIGAGPELTLTLSDGERYRAANGLDIAFLHFSPEASAAPCALTSPYIEFGDRMWAYGHPRGDYRAGQWAGLEYQGDSRIAFDDAIPMPRGYGTPVGEGFSGSPVVNERTGAVCGMLARSNKAGSAHLVPISEVMVRFPVPRTPVAWLGTLTDEQLRAGGFRYPGALLRDYLEAAREAADEHPYAALLTDSGGIPLSTVYVRQEASHTEDRDDESPGHRPPGRSRSAAERVLAEHRHVLFTGGAGSGKSSLLRRLVFTAASEWLGDPLRAPSYVPVLVAADQLLDRPLPEALADALARDLPGLRRSPAPELFENGPLATVDWLVCVDGLDEVLDPGDRGRVIRLIQRWAREPYLRFVVASRSLVTAEMNRLDELERYALLEFDDDEIEQLAHAWFEALDVEDAGRRAGALAGGLRRGRLAEVARNPLYLTMICAVAAVRDLPRNPAGLYARFIGILREKGAQRLVRSDPAVHGITPLLLERVYDALHPVAELRQRGDTRSLLDQVLELLADHEPPHGAGRETVLRALTFTGLVRQRGEDLYFLHHTVQEYLAGHALADRLDPKDPEALRTVREAIAAERPNQALFMAARWHEQGMPIAEFLRAVVDGGGWRDLLLCATILSDELVTDERLTVRFTRAVLKLYSSGDVTVGDLDVDTVLDRLYAVLDPPGLVDVIGDPTVPHWARSGALRHYVRRGAEQAAALAAELADDPDLPADLRVVAAAHLARTDDPGAACRRLTALARDRDHVPETRQEAAVALLALDEAAGTDALALLLRTADFPRTFVENLLLLLPDDLAPQTCAALTDALAGHPLWAEDPHTIRYLSGVLLVRSQPELLEELCADPTVPLYLRHRATQYVTVDQGTMGPLCTQVVQNPSSPEDAIALAVRNVQDAALVERVARDDRLRQYTRLQAVGQLIRLDRPAVAAACLGAFSVNRWHLPRVCELLRELGESARSRQLLLDASEDPRSTVADRLGHVSSLIGLGASDLLRTPLRRMAEDAGVAAADRLEAVDALGDVDPAVTAGLLHDIAADDAVPGRVRRDAAAQLLKTGDRVAASALLRRIAEDTGVGMLDRIKAVDHLADVDLRAAAEILHRVLDEAGLPDEHLWRLLALADAMTPDVTLRRRLDALIDDVTVPTESLLNIEAECLLQVAAVVPRLRDTLTRIAEDPAAGPWARTRAAGALLGLVPYPRWKSLMAGVGPDPMHVLSLHLALGGTAFSSYDPAVWQTLTFAQGEESVTVPVGALAGVDPRAAAAYWTESVERRRPEAVTRLGLLWLLVHDEGASEQVREQLASWVRDSAAPLAERIAAVTSLGASLDESCHILATEDTTPPELRVAICEHLPASGALNRIPVVRTLAADTACPVDVRARAAALLAEDLGEEGRAVLRSLSGPGTTDPEAHLSVAAAWVQLDVGCEAEAAYRRVVEDGHAHARHRVLAADGLMRWRSARDRAREVLRSVLADQDVPVTVRIQAAEKLIAAHEPADAHVGLLRLARDPDAEPAERSRIAELLPADLRAYVERGG